MKREKAYPSGPNGKWTELDTARRMMDLDNENRALRSERDALLLALGQSCPHGCSDGNCPWDRRRRAALGDKKP